MMELTKYKVCPECGKQNPPSLLECRFCEADLTGIRVVDGSAPQQIGEAKDNTPSDAQEMELVRICECGAENAPQARKCKVCGDDISDIMPVRIPGRGKSAFSYELRSVDGGFSVTIDRPVYVVGREAELKDYLASKVYVSRQHARFTVVADKVFVENLSKTNKTFVNNEELPDATPAALRNGDEVGLGGKVIGESRQEKAAYFVFRVKS